MEGLRHSGWPYLRASGSSVLDHRLVKKILA